MNESLAIDGISIDVIRNSEFLIWDTLCPT